MATGGKETVNNKRQELLLQEAQRLREEQHKERAGSLGQVTEHTILTLDEHLKLTHAHRTDSHETLASNTSSVTYQRRRFDIGIPEVIQEVDEELQAEKNPLTIWEKARKAAGALLSLIAIVDVFTFTFVIPFVLDPCITNIAEKYSAHPARCTTKQVLRETGYRNCSWASCRLGCTAPISNCTKIMVEYQLPLDPLVQGEYAEETHSAALFVNSKGCGYSPYTDCEEFEKLYGELDTVFPCHQSGVNPSKVILTYDPRQNLTLLLMGTLIPFFLLVTPVTVLYWWQCFPCQDLPNKSKPLSTPSSSRETDKEGDDDDGDHDDERQSLTTSAVVDSRYQRNYSSMSAGKEATVIMGGPTKATIIGKTNRPGSLRKEVLMKAQPTGSGSLQTIANKFGEVKIHRVSM